MLTKHETNLFLQLKSQIVSIIFENYVRMQNRIKLLAKKRYSFL